MSSNIWIKVVGFTDVERHSLNTLFRLSVHRSPSYALWTPEVSTLAHIALIDMDSYEAGLELASPRFNPNLKLICIGSKTYEHAWHTLERPLQWSALVQLLDGLFSSLSSVDIDIDFDFGDEQEKSLPPGVRVGLLAGMNRDEGLYLRARLALAGMTELDEAQTAAQSSVCLSQRHYDLVIVSLELPDTDPWELVQSLPGLVVPPPSVIVVTHAPTWANMQRAEQSGCLGLLEIPFSPPQVLGLLQQV
jgi:CheY-like chemotaxis protein